MNEKEYLLTCLGEELAEMAQEVAKMLRFTPDNCMPGTMFSNLDRCSGEFSDVIAILEMLRDRGISVKILQDRIDNKKERTLRYMKVSQELGTLYGIPK